nr:MATE family efflux transporter [uncultured Lachnoclostridium sp.]
MKTKNDFTHQLLSLVLPISFQMFMLSLVSVSDAVMLGKLNQDSLSAVSLGSQIAFVFNLFIGAITMGESMFVAQFWGKKDMLHIKKVVALVLRTTLIISFLFSLTAFCAPRLLMMLFTSEENLILLGAKYLRVVAISYMLTGVGQIYVCLMKNCGEAKRSTLISSVMVVLNIVLNAVFIFGLLGMPAMGIEGAALATVISTGVGCVWAIVHSLKSDKISISWCDLFQIKKAEKELSSRFWHHVLPVLGNQLGWGCGVTMYSVILGHLGTDAVAANSIATITKNLVLCFCWGLGSGGSIIVGNALGAGELEKAKEYGKKLCKLSIISGVITGGVLLAAAPFILRFSGISAAAKGYLKGMLLISSYYVVGGSINSMTIGGIFPAGGDSRFGFICDTVTLWCITIPIGALAAFLFKWPVLVVYFLLNQDEIVKLPVVYRHYKKYEWVKNLTQKVDAFD